MSEISVELLIGVFMVIAGVGVGIVITLGILRQRRKDDSHSN
ncbi:MAG: hypothetical protein ACKOXT_06770 [Actinomycetota bacterium]